MLSPSERPSQFQVFRYFIPVAYQHIQQAFTDIKHLIYLKILVGLYGIQQFFRQENIRTGIEIRYINNTNQLIFDRRPVATVSRVECSGR